MLKRLLSSDGPPCDVLNSYLTSVSTLDSSDSYISQPHFHCNQMLFLLMGKQRRRADRCEAHVCVTLHSHKQLQV